MARESELEKRVQQLSPQERYALRMLQKQFKGPKITAQGVARILPEAVQVSEAEHRNLSKSFVEVTERAIDYSVSRDPDTLSTALFPIIGAAIRKAVNRLFTDMMNQLNSGLEKSFSFKRLAWRFEAWKTGVPFMEIVLRNTLEYRVEQVFLIHKKSGLLMSSLSHPEAKTADSDMVASMLTAVRDYIQDSLALEKTSEIQGISAGDHSVLIEEGPLAIVAIIVRGNPDSEVRNAMEEALENIHARYSSLLKNFSGDTGPFEEHPELIRPCLLSRRSGGSGQKPVYAITAFSIIVLLITVAVTFAVLDERERRSFVRALNNESGMVVAAVNRGIFHTRLTVLRDRRAKDIAELAAGHPVDMNKFKLEIEEFVSPDFGTVPYKEQQQTTDNISSAIDYLSSAVILFETNSGDLSPGQEDILRQTGEHMDKLFTWAGIAGVQAFVEIVGHAAGDTQDDLAARVSLERAQRVTAILSGTQPSRAVQFRVRGVGINEPVIDSTGTEDSNALNRSVTFKVIFE